ncbi:hypothetical protein GQ42DRAFT_165657 [Ramicandelaber brevisporus]|nr:hypothetical protein GQ42DRAFT_165657 [Ramicandelaber brevisporus]
MDPTQSALSGAALLQSQHAAQFDSTVAAVSSTTTTTTGAAADETLPVVSAAVAVADDDDDFDYEADDFFGAAPAKKPEPVKKIVAGKPDVSSLDAFPTLGAAKKSTSSAAWGKKSGAKEAPGPVSLVNAASVHSDLVTGLIDLTSDQQILFPAYIPGSTRRQETLTDIVKGIEARTGTTIEMSYAANTGTRSFLIRGRTAAFAAARREIYSRIAKKTKVTLQVPLAARPQIVGPKGQALQAIIKETGASINIDKDDRLSHENEHLEPEEILVDVTIEGDKEGVALARASIEKIVADTVKTKVARLSNIASEYIPLIAHAQGDLAAKSGRGDSLKIRIPSASLSSSGSGKSRSEHIIVTGVPELVDEAVAKIQQIYSELQSTCKTIMIVVPKRQHRFLVGPNGSGLKDILERTNCSVEVPPASSTSEEVVIRGPEASFIDAIRLSMEKSNSAQIRDFDLVSVLSRNVSGTISPNGLFSHGKRILRYLSFKNIFQDLVTKNGNEVEFIYPSIKQLDKMSPSNSTDRDLSIQVVAKSSSVVDKVISSLSDIVSPLTNAFIASVSIDSFLHRHLNGKKLTAQIASSNSVDILFPPTEDHSSDIILVHTCRGAIPAGTDRGSFEKTSRNSINKASEELRKHVQSSANFSTKTVRIPAKQQRLFTGANASNLATVLSPKGTSVSSKDASKIVNEASVLVTFSTNDQQLGEDEVSVRGPTADVERVASSLTAFVEEHERNEVLRSYKTTIDAPVQYLPQIIGRSGANLTKMQQSFDVNIDVERSGASPALTASAATATTRTGAAKQSAVPSGTGRITIQGLQKNAEQCKASILDQIEKLRDHSSIIIRIDKTLHRALIGNKGRYVKKLEDKYSVSIKFPHDNSNTSSGNVTPGEPADGDSIGNGANNIDDITPTQQAASRRPTAVELKSDEISISGGKKGVEGARQELIEAAEYELEHSQSYELVAPIKIVRYLIGRNGARISEIRAESNCNVKVDLDKADQSSGTGTIEMIGNKKQIEAARKLVESIIKERESLVAVTVNVPAAYHGQLIGPSGSTINTIVASAGGDASNFGAPGGIKVDFGRAGDDDGNFDTKFKDDPNSVLLRGDINIVNKVKAELEARIAKLADNVTILVSVPVDQHRVIIGSGGSKVNSLMSKHSVDINFPKKGGNSTLKKVTDETQAAQIADPSLIAVTGLPENVEAAKADILSLVKSEKSIIVPLRADKVLYDPRGRLLTQLRNELNVTVSAKNKKIFSTTTAAAAPTASAAPAQSGASKRIDEVDADELGDDDDTGAAVGSDPVTVIQAPSPVSSDDGEITWILLGSEENLDRAVQLVEEAIASCKDGQYIARLRIPQQYHSSIIGTRGAVVSALRRDTDCEIKVPNKGNAGARQDVVTITGPKFGVEKAIDQIRGIVKQPRQQQRRHRDY